MSTIPYPPTIDFSNLKPKGYSSQVVNREFTPNPFTSQVQQQDLIRFLINQHRGLLDPYSTYFDVEVDFTGMSPTGAQQLDGCAHSLISRLQIYVNGVSIEMIDQYDTLMHFLHDMQMGSQNKKMKISEGVGIDEGGFANGSESYGIAPQISAITQPCQSINLRTQKPNQWLMNNNRVKWDSTTAYTALNGELITPAPNPQANEYRSIITKVLSETEPQDWYNMPLMSDIRAAPQGMNDFAKYIPVDRYETQLFANNFAYSPVCLTNSYNSIYSGNQLNGIFSGNFCNQNFEQIFSTNYFQLHYKNGNMGAYDIIRFGTFQFPLGSSILGSLLPSDSYKYIPFSALPDLVIEITLNKYAFFTSGYIEDVNTPQFGTVNTIGDLGCVKQPITQQQRYWRVTKFNLNCDIILFDDQAIEDMVNAQLVSTGILLHSCGWTLALQQVFQNSAQCAGNFQINYGFESLKALFVIYESNDYQGYSYCRKHFRCSRNLTSIQARIGDKIYPQQPIKGHGGNALKYEAVTQTNQQFVQELYKAFNKQFTINSECYINMANFCPNKRSYNPAAPLVAYFYDLNFHFGHDCQLSMGQTLLFENQLRGMAVYTICFDVLGNDNGVMGGVDTKQNVPFNVLITTDTQDTGNWGGNGVKYDQVAEREVTGQFWMYYDYLLLFKAGVPPQKIGAQ